MESVFVQSRIRIDSIDSIWNEGGTSIKSSYGTISINSFHSIPLVSARDSLNLSWYLRILLFIRSIRINCC